MSRRFLMILSFFMGNILLNCNNVYALDPLKDNNGWFSINQLIKEQSKDPDDSRGGRDFYMLG